MKITTKELRIQPGRIIDQVVNGQDIIVTFRGKALARIIPIAEKATVPEQEEISIFGMWKERPNESSVETTVREIRKGRQF